MAWPWLQLFNNDDFFMQEVMTHLFQQEIALMDRTDHMMNQNPVSQLIFLTAITGEMSEQTLCGGNRSYW